MTFGIYTRHYPLPQVVNRLGKEKGSLCFLCSQHVTPKRAHRQQIGPDETPEVQKDFSGAPEGTPWLPFLSAILVCNCQSGPS